MKKRVLSALMVLCMVLTLLPVSAFAADTKDLRDTEFHIMGFSDLKELVAEQNKVNAEDVTIHGIYVNGTQPNGEPVLRPVVCLRILSKKPPWAMWG